MRSDRKLEARVIASIVVVAFIGIAVVIYSGLLIKRATAINSLRRTGVIINGVPKSDLLAMLPREPAWLPWNELSISIINIDYGPDELQSIGNAIQNAGPVDSLAFSGPNVSDSWITAICPLDNVRILILEESSVTAQGCSNLGEWGRLTILKVQANQFLNVVDLTALGLTDVEILADR